MQGGVDSSTLRRLAMSASVIKPSRHCRKSQSHHFLSLPARSPENKKPPFIRRLGYLLEKTQ
jgi:hypothetical protein